MKDLMGKAIWDYHHGNQPEDLQTETSISMLDELPVEYLFRSYKDMNEVEKKALDLSEGKVLDIGCGAGSHSLYLQNEKKMDVTALDVSPKSVEIAKERGVEKAVCENMLHFSGKFDTILMLMNGTGIFESLGKVDVYFRKLKTLLNIGGQILIDGTDIIYMYDQDEDGGYFIPGNGYYGEVDYIVHYKGETEDPMKWLYLDFDTLNRIAENHSFKAEKVVQNEFSYLAKLTLK